MQWTQQAMAKRMQWDRAHLDRKAKRSLGDEAEFLERDRAARWLKQAEERRQKQTKRVARKQRAKRNAPAEGKPPNTTPVASSPAPSKERPPWED